MATVPDLAHPLDPLDKPLTKYNRTNAGDPNGTVTPLFSGEIVLDTTNHDLWQAQSPTLNTSWVLIQPDLGA